METARPHLFVVAESPDAFHVILGVSVVDRLLRIAQRIGFRKATIVSSKPEIIQAELSAPSWARADVALRFVRQEGAETKVGDILRNLSAERALVVSAGYYYDARLLGALAELHATTLLIDSQSNVPSNAALVERPWLETQDRHADLFRHLSLGAIAHYDAATAPGYVVSMRRNIPPTFFPARTSNAEQVVRNAAQKGTLDFPGVVHGPIENRIVAYVCRWPITPNQITGITALIASVATVLFASGQLWWGTAVALITGVLDGVDGKLARTKVETTAAGKWEHVIDYFIEVSWWLALAWHFRAYALVALLIVSDATDLLVRRSVKRRLGRDIDDISNFDRFVRCIGARRNINIWMLAAGLLLGDPGNAFVLICGWTAATTAVHVVRAMSLSARAA